LISALLILGAFLFLAVFAKDLETLLAAQILFGAFSNPAVQACRDTAPLLTPQKASHGVFFPDIVGLLYCQGDAGGSPRPIS
jgi:hypothetical protein